ncbi:MAG: tetratricopeptide repeat protein [Bacteroidaceae bacterium]|nr:tetratricopeptide repeat protein [Bacteroidaceae bacterium]
MAQKNKLYSLCRIFILAILLLNGANSYAINDTLQVNVLNKAQSLIDTSDKNGAILFSYIEEVKEQKELPDSTFVQLIVKDIATHFRQLSQQSNAIEVLSEATKVLEKHKSDKSLFLKLYLPLGAAFEEVGLWSTAIDYYHKALSITQELDSKGYIARIYNNIGVAYYKIDLDKSIEYILKSLEINKMLGDKKELYLNYNNLAAIHVELKLYDEALDYALMAMHMIDKNTNPDKYYFMQCNIGSLYSQAGNYNLAISYIENCIDYFNNTNNYAEQTRLSILLAEAYKKSGQTEKAKKLIDLIENTLIPRTNNAELESSVRTTLATFFEEDGQYHKAYKNLKIAQSLKDSLQKANDELKVSNLEKIYENEQKIRENTLTINELQLKKMASDRQISIGLIALLILSIILIIFIIRTRIKDNLIKTNAMLAEQEKILQDKEKELQNIKEQELKRTIDQKNRELSSYALSYTKDNEFLANLGEELKKLLLEIYPRDKEHREHIRIIITQLKQHCTSDNWQEFRYYFEQVHPSFYDRLDNISPGMTQRQKRLCAMLYIGLSTKEISSITFREVRSIESARNRLRKKLDITGEETIQEFLSRKLDTNTTHN